jgi:hypothetical protein
MTDVLQMEPMQVGSALSDPENPPLRDGLATTDQQEVLPRFVSYYQTGEIAESMALVNRSVNVGDDEPGLVGSLGAARRRSPSLPWRP